MNNIIIDELAKEIKIKPKQVEVVLNLLADENTVPFIARYRKEMTGSLDEEQIRIIEKQYKYQVELLKRKDNIISLIDEKEMLTDELVKQINECTTKQKLEDIYMPYKDKKKTKATEAVKKGLQPLADFILSEPIEIGSVLKEAEKYIDNKLSVKSVDDAIEGASYIIAEKIADNLEYKEEVRNISWKSGKLESSVKKNYKELDPKEKYKIYYEFSEDILKAPNHRIFALNRAENEKVITVKLLVDVNNIHDYLYTAVIKNSKSDSAKYIKDAIEDGYKRLMKPSIEREIRNSKLVVAEEAAFSLFGKNLEQLIMEQPLKDKIILAIDPAFRTGCKIAVIDASGKAIHIDIIYPHEPKMDISGSTTKILKIIEEFSPQQVVGGNGTASRETEQFMKKIIKDHKLKIDFAIVSEAGASVYSASKIAKDEFPDLSVEQRSAISIARRVQDPMAELVKIDPQSIGVGQYQHDVNQKALGENLEFTILKNVNIVGVDINTSSIELLKYVSGLNKTSSKKIILFREKTKGGIKSRKELIDKKILSAKIFEQAAGFLKIFNGSNPLDETFIHPENYSLAENLMEELKIKAEDFGTDDLVEKIDKIDKKKLADKYNKSEIIIDDIINAMLLPNLDPRKKLKVAKFSSKIQSIDDIKVGGEIEGIVRNIVDFGAFIDIGIKNDGMVHISELSNNYVSDVSTILTLGDIKKFKVINLDVDKGRVALSLKQVIKN